MSVAVANSLLLTDGDAAFVRVNNRLPAHALGPGEVVRAVNMIFDQGKPRPRLGVACDPWGQPNPNLAADAVANPLDDTHVEFTVSGLTIGRVYTYVAGTMTSEQLAGSGFTILTTSGTFTATETTVRILGIVEDSAAATTTNAIVKLVANTCGYKRFNDPITGTDNGILLTDEWRDGAGEDGGKGRAWRIYPGNGPQLIPMNGHDIWGTARLVQCRDAMVMLRQGNERHYFIASALNVLDDYIQLNTAPSWAVGTAKRIRFELATTDAGVAANLQNIINTDMAADTLTIFNHGIANGTAKYIAGITGLNNVVKYVRSVGASTISLYDTAAHAIAGGGTGLFDVTVNGETGTISDRAPAPGNYYYAKHVATAAVELYADSAMGADSRLIWSAGSTGKFYISLEEAPAAFYGNGAPPLILQASAAGNTGFEVGFDDMPANVAITSQSSALINAPNHRLNPGDAVTLTGVTFTASMPPFFARPTTAHAIELYSSAVGALAGTAALKIADITSTGAGSLSKTGAAGLSMPPLREGAFIAGRLWGINERDTVVISDPNDFLHFSPYTSTVPANQGEAGRANWILPLGEDAIAIGKDLKIIVITGIAGSISTWKEGEVTDDHGGIAALAALRKGTDIWCFSRKGVASIIRTVAGEKLGATRTISQNIPEDLKDVDWVHASIACSEIWNNRYFLAVPMKGQSDASDAVNNRVLVLNLLNENLQVQQSDIAGDIVGGVVETDARIDSWEGYWEGDLLTPYAFARLSVNGEERLTFAMPDGSVCWLHDGWDDASAEIPQELLTRAYFGGRPVLTLKGKFNWDSYRPKISASILTAGVNEETDLAGFDEKEYSNTEYEQAGAPAYDPNTSTEETFSAPGRADYSPEIQELLVAQLDLHQNHDEPFRCFERGTAPQLRINNTQGSLRVCSVSLQARPAGIAGARTT